MTTDYDPVVMLPEITAAIQQGSVRVWSLEEGESLVTTYKGPYSVLEVVYNQYVDAALEGNPSIASVELPVTNGRATLTIRTVNQSYSGTVGEGDRIDGVEELYPVDITKDVAAAPKYESLSSGDIAKVKRAIADLMDGADAYAYLGGDGLAWDLWKRYTHGENNYLALSYVFRRSYVTNSSLRAITLLGTVNTVIPQATLVEAINSKIATVVAAVPSGEWLVRTPKVSFQGRGKYHIEEEYQWAVKWSDLYTGGTLVYS
jgi:hypothetical protein